MCLRSTLCTWTANILYVQHKTHTTAWCHPCCRGQGVEQWRQTGWPGGTASFISGKQTWHLNQAARAGGHHGGTFWLTDAAAESEKTKQSLMSYIRMQQMRVAMPACRLRYMCWKTLVQMTCVMLENHSNTTRCNRPSSISKGLPKCTLGLQG